MSFEIVCLHYTKCTLAEAEIHIQKFSLLGKLNSNTTIIKEFHAPIHVQEPTILVKCVRDSYDGFIKFFFFLNLEISDIKIKIMLSKSMENPILIKCSVKPGSWHHITNIMYKDDTKITIQFFIEKEKKFEHKLMNDFNNLFKDGLFSDGTIESCDGVSFKVHKCVLASRSNVFRAHFEHDSAESQTGIIKSAFDAEVLSELLNYVYSGEEAINLDKVSCRLFVAADFYQLTDLKSLCEEFLYKQLTVENVIDTLKLADLHSAPNLRKLAMEFIQLNANTVFTNPAWADFKSIEMLKALCEHAMIDPILSVEQT